MKRLADRLSIGDIFGLDQSDLTSVERITLSPPEGDGQNLYLFRCEDLLPEGERLAIDERCGTIGVYRDGVLVKKTAVEPEEIGVLTILALSFPFPVGERQVHGVSLLQGMKERDQEALSSSGKEDVMPSVEDLVATCNEKISALGLVLVSTEASYPLTAVGERGGEKTRVVCMKACFPGV